MFFHLDNSQREISHLLETGSRTNGLWIVSKPAGIGVEVVRHRDKEHVVGLGGLGQDLLEAGPLVRPEAAADAILEVGAAACHLEQFHFAMAM